MTRKTLKNLTSWLLGVALIGCFILLGADSDTMTDTAFIMHKAILMAIASGCAVAYSKLNKSEE